MQAPDGLLQSLGAPAAGGQGPFPPGGDAWLAECLGFQDVRGLCDTPPPGVDGAAIRAALTATGARIPAPENRRTVAWRLHVMADAGRELLKHPPHLEAALHLTRQAPAALRDAAPLAHVRLVALCRLGRHGELVAEADRILAMPGHSRAERAAINESLRLWNLERELPLRMERVQDYWPDLEAALDDPLSGIDGRGVFPWTPGCAERVAALRGLHSPESRAEFRERLGWGAEWFRRFIFMRRMTAPLLCAPPGTEFTEMEERLLTLCSIVNEMIQLPDPTRVFETCAAGRSAVVTMAHAGQVIGNSNLGLDGVFPLTTVSAGQIAFSPRHPEDSHIATQEPGAALAFARLAKSMRRKPRIVRIHPDGAHGETVPIQVLGRPVPIGRGAAFLAHLSGADTFFLHSRWDHDELGFRLLAGPRAIDYPDRDGFEAAFNRFYAECLEGILLGPPEDMAPDGGFWNAL